MEYRSTDKNPRMHYSITPVPQQIEGVHGLTKKILILSTKIVLDTIVAVYKANPV
jgi:hypothetical protein